jgi:hypothetical protein
MPRSNKTIAGLPNPCPIGLQSLRSILPGSLTLELCQAIAPHQTHTRRDTCCSAMLASSSRSTPHRNTHPSATLLDPQPLGSPLTVHARPQPRAGPTGHRDTCPPPPKLTTLQALLSPSYVWDDCTPPVGLPPPIRPCQAPAPCGMTGAPPAVAAPAWHETATFTSPPGTPPLDWSRPQLYRLPR